MYGMCRTSMTRGRRSAWLQWLHTRLLVVVVTRPYCAVVGESATQVPACSQGGDDGRLPEKVDWQQSNQEVEEWAFVTDCQFHLVPSLLRSCWSRPVNPKISGNPLASLVCGDCKLCLLNKKQECMLRSYMFNCQMFVIISEAIVNTQLGLSVGGGVK